MKKFKIDLSKASGYIEGEEERIIRKELKKQELYNPGCIYSVFNANREKQILEKGNYRKGNPDSIFALTKEDLVWNAEPGIKNDLKRLTNSYKFPAIAIYSKDKFYQDGKKGDYRWEYFFNNSNKKLEALLGIAILDMPEPDF